MTWLKKYGKALGHYTVLAGSLVVAYAPDLITTLSPFFPGNRYIQIAAAVVMAITATSAARHIKKDETMPDSLGTGTAGWLMKKTES